MIEEHDEIALLRAELQGLKAENEYLRSELEAAGAYGDLVGISSTIRQVRERIDALARADTPILLVGERGVGKELVARKIHATGARNMAAFVRVGAAGMSRDELHRRLGLAGGGTLYVDRIGELAPDAQRSLLEALDAGKAVARVVASTPTDLRPSVEAGRLLAALHERLRANVVTLPALREHREDVLPLAAHFVATASRRLGVEASPLDESRKAALLAYDWPGNVRELENAVERAVLLARGGPVHIELCQDTGGNAEIISDSEWRRLERDNVMRALARASGRIYGNGGAAQLLGLKPSTLQSRLRAFGITARQKP